MVQGTTAPPATAVRTQQEVRFRRIDRWLVGGALAVAVVYSLAWAFGLTEFRLAISIFAILPALGAALFGVTRLRGADRLAIGLILVAVALGAGSIVANFVAQVFMGDAVGRPTPADVFGIATYAVLAAGLLAFLPWRRQRGASLERTLDVLIFFCSAVIISWIFVFAQVVPKLDLPTLVIVMDLYYPAAEVLLLSICTILALQARGHRRTAFLHLLAGLAGVAVMSIVYTVLSFRATPAPAGLLDPLVALAALLAGSAFLRLALATDEATLPLAPPSKRATRLAFLPAGLVIPPGVFHYVRHGGLDPIVFTTAVVLFSAIVLRQFVYAGRVFDLKDDLHAANADLERRVRARTRALADANIRLEELSTMKTEFLNRVSHELRTPLTPLLLQADLTAEGAHGLLNERQQRALETIRRNLERLDGILNEVTRVALVQGNGIRIEARPEDLGDLLAGTAESVQRDAAAATPISIDPGPRLSVHVDPVLMRRALSALLREAQRIQPAQHGLKLSWTRQADVAELTIGINGVNLHPATMAEAFEPFAVWMPAGPEVPTLGAFIARTIVEEHGGRVWMEPLPDLGGTRIRLLVPAVPAKPAGRHLAVPAPSLPAR